MTPKRFRLAGCHSDMLQKKLFGIFINIAIKKNGSQYIFKTHENDASSGAPPLWKLAVSWDLVAHVPKIYRALESPNS